jgi:hypothetical protein
VDIVRNRTRRWLTVIALLGLDIAMFASWS